MAINTKKVVLGGIVAGVVTTAVGFAAQQLLGARMKAEMDAFKPGIVESMMTGSALATNVVMNLIFGIALVWTYAAIRPRFGAGPRTAAYAALLFFVVTCVLYSGYYLMGMMSAGLWISEAVVGLVSLLLSAWAGGAVYTEDVATASA